MDDDCRRTLRGILDEIASVLSATVEGPIGDREIAVGVPWLSVNDFRAALAAYRRT